MALLHLILNQLGATVYDYAYIYGTKISADVENALRTLPHLYLAHFLCQLFDSSTVIGIGIFVLATIFDLIKLIVSDLIRLTVFDWM